MRIIRLLAILAICVAGALLLVACGGSGRPCADLLNDFCGIYESMPAGQAYISGAAEWEEGYLSPSLADALFCEDNGENAFSLCTEYAIFLSSSREGGEIAFLRAGGTDEAKRLSDMCAARIARARRIMADADFLRGACVLQNGRDVILLMLPDNTQAKEICRGLY